MYWFVGIVIGLVLLLQLPLLVDLLRVILPGRSITRLTNKLTSLLLMYFMTVIFIVVLGYFLLIFLPLTIGDLYSIKGACHIAFALWLWSNVIGHYYYAVFLRPGEATLQAHGSSKTETNTKSDGNEPVAPRSALEWQPKTSHYCRQCKVQVSYMDHHCPFTNNCVGERNHSHFVLGLTYGTVGLTYAVVLSFPAFRECVLSAVWTYLRFGRRSSSSEFCTSLSVHSMIFFAAFAGLLSVFFMSVVHWLLLLADVPTGEVMRQYGRVPVFKFMWQRMVGKKFLEPNSRLRVLLLNQRPNPLWFLLPLRNYKPKSE